MAAANDFINTTDITDAGGNLASASGNISTSTTIKGAVGYGRNTTSFDAADFYKLSIGTTGTATLKLTGLSDNLQLVLKNSDGSNLNMSLTAGTADESVSYPVSPGTYYAYVYPDGYNQSAYTLNVSLPTTRGHDTIGDADVTDAGASLATASGSISASSTIKGSVGYGAGTGNYDQADFYKIIVSTSGTSEFHLSGLADNLNMSLKDSAGSNFKLSLNAATADEIISVSTPPGTYYLQIYPEGYASSFYNLQLTLPTAQGAGQSSITGKPGNDSFQAGSQNESIDGADGVDSISFDKGASAYSITTANNGQISIKGTAGETHTTKNIERLKFADKSIAFDLTPDGHAGEAISLLGLFAPQQLSNLSVRGQLIGFFDQGISMEALCQIGLDLNLIDHSTNQALALAAFRNVLGGSPDSTQTNALVSFINTYGQAKFLAAAASLHLNVDLNALQKTGLEFQTGNESSTTPSSPPSTPEGNTTTPTSGTGSTNTGGTTTGTSSSSTSKVIDLRSVANGTELVNEHKFDAADGAYKFVLDMSQYHPSPLSYNNGNAKDIIYNFGADDSIQIINQSAFSVLGSDTGKDVLLTGYGVAGYEDLMLVGANPAMKLFADAQNFNALPVGDIEYTGQTGTTPPSTPTSAGSSNSSTSSTAKVIDLRSAANGTNLTNEHNYDASTGSYKFVLDMSQYHPSSLSYNNGNAKDIIYNFGADDSIQIINQSSFSVLGSDTGKDVWLTAYGVAGYEDVILVGVNSTMKLFADAQSFNALPVGDLLF